MHVDRVDRPMPGLYAIGISTAGRREVLLIAAGPPRRKSAWAIVADRPRGEPADTEVRALRERIDGARVLSMFDDHGLVLSVARGPLRSLVTADGRRGLTVSDATEHATPTGELVDDAALDLARARGADFVAGHRALLAEDARAAAHASIAKARAKLLRRVDAIRGDQRAVALADERAAHASLFVAAASHARRGVTRLDAIDYRSGTAEAASLEIAPDTSARAQLDAIFARAKRLRAGQRVADARLYDAELALLALDDADADVARADGVDGVRAAVSRVERQLPRDLSRGRPPLAHAPREKEVPLPRGVRAFVASSGAPIFVGKDAESNDSLTTKLARPGDLWLHARDVTGAHVVVPRWYRSGQLDADTLLDAATLAAHFSDARGEAIVDVSYTDRRFVKKSRGAAAGAVTLLQEKVLPLRVEATRLARLIRG